jgi:TonB family protein
VRDSTGIGIVGAELTVEGARSVATTDERGAFRLGSVPSGTVMVHARRLGYRPATVEAVVEPGATRTLTVTIGRLVPELSAVIVRGARRQPTGEYGGFYDRLGNGFGYFITRDQIERRNPSQTTDMMRSVPGVRLISTRYVQRAIRLRSANANCPPQYWMDGIRLGEEYDMDFLDPASVEGIEVYSMASVPARFMVGPERRICGTIVMWTRHGERRPRTKQVTAAELSTMVASLSIYTADQVDSTAHLDTAGPIKPVYPDSLYRAHVPGETLVEFVVDATGDVEMETFGVVSSTHPLFAESVRRALYDAEFVPARLGGRRVRQLVQQPYHFVLADSAKARRP